MLQLIFQMFLSEGITRQPFLSFLHPLNNLLSTDVEILVAGVSILIDDFRTHFATGIQEQDSWNITPIGAEIFIFGLLFILLSVNLKSDHVPSLLKAFQWLPLPLRVSP